MKDTKVWIKILTIIQPSCLIVNCQKIRSTLASSAISCHKAAKMLAEVGSNSKFLEIDENYPTELRTCNLFAILTNYTWCLYVKIWNLCHVPSQFADWLLITRSRPFERSSNHNKKRLCFQAGQTKNTLSRKHWKISFCTKRTFPHSIHSQWSCASRWNSKWHVKSMLKAHGALTDTNRCTASMGVC